MHPRGVTEGALGRDQAVNRMDESIGETHGHAFHGTADRDGS